MWKYLLFLLAVIISACNLSSDSAVEPAAPTATALILTFLPQPTPALTSVNPSPLRTAPPSSSGLDTGMTCDVYTTWSGTDPRNVLSMRAEPRPGSTQVARVPNNTPVYLVPGSEEVEAEGYHWLNVIYVDAQQNRYEGWIARDSYMRGGVRDPAISTLRPAGRQSTC